MYRLLSSQSIIDNVVTLTLPFLENKKNINAETLKKAYRLFLLKLQPHCPHINNHNLFYCDSETEKLFEPYFQNEEIEIKVEKKLLYPVLYPNPLIRQMALKNSLYRMQKIDPNFFDLFHLIINTIFCTTTERLGGTSVNPRYIGVMCAYYDMRAEEKAIPELLIHEFTHNVLFLDELRYSHYHYEKLREEDALIQIETDEYQFPISFHRCLHSLIVNAEILLARDAFIGHEELITQHLSSDTLMKRAKIYIASTEKNQYLKNVMTERSRFLFEKAKQFYFSK